MPRPTFVIFDLDGTIADSQEGILYSFHATLNDLGKRVPDDELRALIGPPLGESFARLGVNDSDLAQVVALYRSYYDRQGVERAHLYDGVRELLEQLHEAGVRLAVATAKRVDFATRMLGRLGVLDLFHSVSGASLDGLVNTKQEIVHEALQLLAGPSGVGWMVGDRREDLRAAAFHSLVPVGVLWGYGSFDELVENGAQILATTPGDVLREFAQR